MPDIEFKNDPRTIDELVNSALFEMDEELEWNAVCTLQWRGTREVLERAALLAKSPSPLERRLSAYILGQLGLPDRTFPLECSKLLCEMLTHGEEAIVLEAALVGLSFQQSEDAVPLAVEFSTHSESGVRHAAVLALTGHEDQLAVETLISLSRDPDECVRDWATFALGTQIELDSPQIRNALAERLDDSDDGTRGEAMVGLARRKDERAIEALKIELSSECIGTHSIEAAELIATSELLPHLVALRDSCDVDPSLLERAISASK